MFGCKPIWSTISYEGYSSGWLSGVEPMVLEAERIAECASYHFYKLKVTLLLGSVVCVVLSTTPRIAKSTVYFSEDMSHVKI